MSSEKSAESTCALTRRAFVRAAVAVPLAAALPAAADLPSFTAEGASALGEWAEDAAGLPCFRYTGPLAFTAPESAIKADYLPGDPYFLLGNYRLTLFAHVSGMLQILSGERAWGRLNQGPKDWSGSNKALVKVGTSAVRLVGEGSDRAESFEAGIGYAQYRYRPTSGLRVTRTVSVLPSSRAGEGTSAFVVSVTLQNESGAALNGAYAESFAANYAQIFAPWDAERKLVRYEGKTVDSGRQIRCDFKAHESRPFMFSHSGRMARFEGSPPSLFLQLLPTSDSVHLRTDASQAGFIGMQASYELNAGASAAFHFIVGYAFAPEQIEPTVRALSAAIGTQAAPLFREAWKQRIPAFADEHEADLRREMRWNAGVLEQMATWREYYDEAVIPQGMVYDYQWGNMASSRDLAQQALPMCHLNPAIARSTLRYIMKRTIPDGEIKLDDLGFGWTPHSGRLTSDQQLYFFMLMNEYLRATGDSRILTEPVEWYPREAGAKGSGLDHVRQSFVFLRDRIGTGPHGLVKLWNSDWNDMFFFWPTSESYNSIFDSSESHMNTAMACVTLHDLADALSKHASGPEAKELATAVTDYRERLLKAFMADWGNAPFPKRMYFQHQAVGSNDMWLEPQGFTLLIPELPADRKRRLYAEMQTRLIRGETMGPKQIEKPVVKPGTPPGSRENGGFWYALTGPVVLGVATFDRNAARQLLQRMTFANYAAHFPNYWIGQWTAPDSLDSSSLPTQGLSVYMTYCAHAHAWPLYCYLRLQQA